MPSLGGLRSDPAEIDSRSSIRSDLLNPLARSSDMLDLTAAPRSVRELIDSPPLTSDRDRASWVLDRDTTRDELNPFTPRPREDYQLSGGDSRLGIAAAGASAARARSLSPFRDQNPRIGPSSLAPALILPTPESVVIPARRTTEAQLPSRRF
jgi:hypothetical protein